MPASVRQMESRDLPEAARIFRLAFGTFVGAPDPASFQSDRDFVQTRWRSHPERALVAEIDGRIAGSNFATRWGSFGFFGPLTVHPDFWGNRVAQQLLGPTMDLFAKWGVRDAALFTFANSPKHLALYQKFDFWPRCLTAVLSRQVIAPAGRAISYSQLSATEQQAALSACRVLTDSIHNGLDLTTEIRSVFDQALGETVLLWGGESLDGFAVCHCGEGTEAGLGNCYIKFAAACDDTSFERLLDACGTLAAQRGLDNIEAGVNTARVRAYRKLLQIGFRTQMLGVAMHKPATGGYDRPDVFVIDDLR